MKRKNFTRLVAILLIGFQFIINDSIAQAVWSGVYGNEWLAGRYNQQWLRIPVTQKGVHVVALSGDFVGKQTRLHLYHRGEEVALLSSSANSIEFYGVPNDGALDALLYRLQSSRTNPYYSTYSDESSYFLTFDTNNNNPTLLAAAESLTPSGTPLDFHNQKYLKTFVTESPHMTSWPQRPVTLNSYFEEGESGMGTRLATPGTMFTTNPASPKYSGVANVASPFEYKVSVPYNAVTPLTISIRLKAGYASCIAEVHAGKTPATLRNTGNISLTPDLDQNYNFDLTSDDYDASGVGTLGFKKLSGGTGSGFRVAFYTLTYKQQIDMQNLKTYQFNFPATVPGTSRFTIANPIAGAKFINISNINKPVIINGSASDLMVSRDDKELTLLATNEIITVDPSKVKTANFQNIIPSNYDYLIISNQTLLTSAATYAAYRQNTSPGKKYKPLVTDIRDIYNQFNYGEPSPVAIRRYVNYMISDGNKSKFLLLLGKSVSSYEDMVREIPDEVPTVGFPGSDLLLVDGLGGELDDVPAIPVGRISAISNQQVLDYLAKVTIYENQKDIAWRKNVIQMSGGKTDSEIESFATSIATVNQYVTSAPFSGKVVTKAKPSSASTILEVSLAPELNGETVEKGIGMISYLGHGSTTQTDYNAGYAMDPLKGYNNSKYPVVYYTGCGVNNVFSNYFAEYSSSYVENMRAMSLDWLLAPGKGAILVFGNTWDAYESVIKEYMGRLYPVIFSASDAQRLTMGEILKEVARQTKIAKGYTYNTSQNARVAAYYQSDRAHIHQTLLQGDPAIRILLTEASLPVALISFDAKLISQNKVEINWKTATEKNNSHFIIERSYNAKNFELIGQVEGKGDSNSESQYDFYDTNPLSGTSYYRLKQVDRETSIDGKITEGEISYSKIVSINRPETDILIISPNPSSDNVEIKLDIPVGLKNWNLFDIQGKSVLKNGTGVKVSLSNLPSGEYILEIITKNGDVYHKKVVKH